MKKVVINCRFGGFSLSDMAVKELGLDSPHSGIERDDPRLVALVEKLGSEAVSGDDADLDIVEIPDDVKWQIEEYDGLEHVAEVHRTWS